MEKVENAYTQTNLRKTRRDSFFKQEKIAKEIYAEFVNQIKEVVSKQPIPPHYNLHKWKNKDFNCYAYVYGL